MAKKQNHKIFNLIIMIIGIIAIFGVPNFVYADVNNPKFIDDPIDSGTSVYTADQDYVPEEDDDPNLKENKNGGLWKTINTNTFFTTIRSDVAKWYYVFRYIGIALMLILLLVISLKLAFASMAPKKALYKRMLLDWIVCFVLLFLSHYFMIGVQYLNETLLDIFRNLSNSINTDGKYDLYQTVKSRAYDVKFTVGFTGMFLYMALVWLTIKYIYIYAKRFILIVVLTILAPITTVFYSFQKILTGKSKLFSRWLEEYFVNVILQSIHALTYVVFVGIALKLTKVSLAGVILAFVFLNFMSKAEAMFRRIFKFSDGSSLAEELANSQISDLTDTLGTAIGVGVMAKDTNIGQGVVNAGSYLLKFPASFAIQAASNLKNGDENRELKLQNDVAKAEAKAKRLEAQQRNIAEKLALQQDEKLEKQKKKLDRAVFKAKENQKHAMKVQEKFNRERQAKEDEMEEKKQRELEQIAQEGMTYKRAIYMRMKDWFDPDNYLEYDYDEEPDENLLSATKKFTKFMKSDGSEQSLRNITSKESGTLKLDKYGRPKKRLLKAKKLYNAETGQIVTVGGIAAKFNEKKDDFFGFTDEHKELLNEAKEDIKKGVMGFGGILLGMASFTDNPTLGFAALAKGISDYRSVTKFDDSVDMDLRARLRMLKIMRRENKKFREEHSISVDDENAEELIGKRKLKLAKMLGKKQVFVGAHFSTDAVLNIDETIRKLGRTKFNQQNINHFRSLLKVNDLRVVAPLIPGTFFGIKGAAYHALDLGRRMAAQNEEDIRTYERSLDVELMKSLAIELAESEKILLERIATHINTRPAVEFIEEIRQLDGTIVKSTQSDVTFVLNSKENRDVVSTHSRMRQAIIEAALENNIYNLDEFDLKNSKLRNSLISSLVKHGLLDEAKQDDSNEIIALLYGTRMGETEKTQMMTQAVDEILQSNEIEWKVNDGVENTVIIEQNTNKGEKVKLKFGAIHKSNNGKNVVIEAQKGVDVEIFIRELNKYIRLNPNAHVKAKINGFEIDSKKLKTVDSMMLAYKNYLKANSTVGINPNSVLYSKEYKDLGIENVVKILQQTTPQVLEKKLFEKIVSDYIRTNDVKSREELLNVRNKLLKFYQKELDKDPLKRSMVAVVARQNSDFSKINATDFINSIQAEEINLFKRQVTAKINKEAKKVQPPIIDLSEGRAVDIISKELIEIGDNFDKVILGVLANHNISDASTVDLANDSTQGGIKSEILSFLRMQGYTNEEEELLSIAQSRIDSVTPEQIEDTIIGNIVAKFIEQKCDGDASKIQNDDALAQELTNVISEALEKLHPDSNNNDDSQKIIEALKDKARNKENVKKAGTSSSGQVIIRAENQENIDNNLDPNIPFPAVKTEVVNDIIVCYFSIPAGLENVKVETCVKTLLNNQNNFKEIDQVNLENKEQIACARLIKADGKYGPTLVIRYPSDEDIMADRVERSIQSSSKLSQIRFISQDVFSDIEVYDENAPEEEKVGKAEMEVIEDDAVEKLLKAREIQKAKNKCRDVIKQIQDLKLEITKEKNKEETREIINGTINQIDSIVGGIDSFEDVEEFDNYRIAVNDLVSNLLQMKIVNEDAEALKMSKDSKNNKKFLKAKDSINDELNKIDVQEIIESMYSKIGG